MNYALPASLLINVILLLLLVAMFMRTRKPAVKSDTVKPKTKSKKTKTSPESGTRHPLTQARELLAQNKVAQAVGFCEMQLDQDPTNHDLRLFLMAIYVKTRQADAFENQYDIICHQADAETVSKANALRSRFEVSPNDIPKSKIDAIQSERSTAREANPATDSVADIPTLSPSTPSESPQELEALEFGQSAPSPSAEPDNLDIDFDLEPSLDQTLLDLENEMTKSAMSSVSLTNLKITLDEDINEEPETNSSSAEQGLSFDVQDSSSSSADETSQSASVDPEPNVIEFESTSDTNSADNLSLDDISYELDFSDDKDESNAPTDSKEATDLEPLSELSLSLTDDSTEIEDPQNEFGDIGEQEAIPTLDHQAEPESPSTGSDNELGSAENDHLLAFEINSEAPASNLEATPSIDDIALSPEADDLSYQLDMEDESSDSEDNNDTFDFGEALSGDALDQIDLDDRGSEPGIFDLSMQFEAVQEPKPTPSPIVESKVDSASLDDELNFGFSLESEADSSEDSIPELSISLDDDLLELGSDSSSNQPQPSSEGPVAELLELSDSNENLDSTAAEQIGDADQISSEAMPSAEFDFDFEEADTEEEPTLISPALNQSESKASPTKTTQDQAESPDIDDDWFASLDREFSDMDAGESTHVNLKLAKEYIRLGEKSGAQSLLEDVIEHGADDDRHQAQKLLDSM